MTTCKTVLEIAIRLESGFKKRFQKIDSGDLPSADRWVNCAIGLLLLHQQDERYPLDPELFVAVMTEAVAIRLLFSGAIDLAMAHYSKAIRTMVRRLRAEISEELKWLKLETSRGQNPEGLILSPSRQITPLSQFIHAHRLNRSDLADQLVAQVLRQHETCPLYQQAASKWLEKSQYPAFSVLVNRRHPRMTPDPHWDVSHN
ncbi:MAG: hypothetical protein WCJ40_15315 [Planctomycetota bacterium]|jgi:hypothetical protein